jgi:ABC-type multidrug transport system fused ATPase/permease subunit
LSLSKKSENKIQETNEKITGWLFPVSVLRQFPSHSLVLFFILIVNTFLASASAGIFLPTIEILLSPENTQSGSYEFLSYFLDDLSSRSRLVFVLSGMLAVFTLKFFVQILRVYVSKLYSEKCRRRWVSIISDKYFHATLTEIKQKKPGTLSHNLVQEPLRASRFVFNQFEFVAAFLAFVGLFLIASFVNWKVVVSVGLGLGVVFVLYRKYFAGIAYELGKERVGHHHDASGQSTETLINLRDVKALSIEGRQQGILMDTIRRLGHVMVKIAVYQEIPRAAPELMGVVFFASFIAVSTLMLGNQFHEFIPQLAFFAVVFMKLLQQVSLLMAYRMTILNDLYSFRLMESESVGEGAEENNDLGQSLSSIDTDLKFEDVSFRYVPGEPVIDGMDLNIPFGNLVFLLGPSGSGKSTLADMLVRFLSPDSGRIVVNDSDISKFKIKDWRRVIGYIGQEANLFHGTIMENVLLGAPDVSPEEVESACRAAGAYDFISRLTKGFDTVVGEQGDTISGGQRKRIAIARTLVRKPSALILDETTSSFEINLETEILDSLIKYPGLKTIIVITHRLESAKKANIIHAIEKGKVVASGRYEQVRRDYAIFGNAVRAHN